MKPSLRQLEYLVAVAEKLSFHQAADACHVTQPGLSIQIQQLESLLDIRLFERDRRRVMVTPAGEELVRRARLILAEVDQLMEAARVFTKPLSGKLRLGVIPTVAPYLLPQILPEVRLQYPELQLLLHEEQTARLLQLLKEGRLDLLLLALIRDLGEVETLALYEDPFVLVAPANHPLGRRRILSEEDLAGEQVLLLEDGHCLRDQALALCSSSGANELGDFRASSLGTLTQMVASGVGITLLPQMSLAVEVHPEDELVVRPFNKPVPHRTIGLAWRKSSPRGDEFRLLAELLRPRRRRAGRTSKGAARRLARSRG